ncbi:MAG: hypothetical protein VKJ24_15065 [Synechococcales bacterium]|nr:hypothetical protein [Synechococcales bacterium]
MLRSIQLLALCSFLALTALSPLAPIVQPAVAQSAARICHPNEPLVVEAANLEIEASNLLDRADAEKALTALQASMTIATQLRNVSLQSNLIQSWLLEPYNGFPTTRLAQLNQQLNASQKSLALVKQFRTLMDRLPIAHHDEKTRASVAIARQYATLGQTQTALTLMAQARQSESAIKLPHQRSIALIEMAEGLVELSQLQAAQATLVQVEREIPRIRGEEATRLSVQERTAILYARIGNDQKSQQILQQLRVSPDVYASAQNGIVGAYIQTGKLVEAEKVARAIVPPRHKLSALTKVAIAHRNNLSQSNSLFRQALTIARSQSDVSLRDSLLQTLIAAHLQVGQLEPALQITRSLKFSHSPTMKLVIAAHHKAGKSAQTRQLLLQELTAIKRLKDAWEQRGRLSDLLQTATAMEQFEWIRQEWATIATIDYGLQDWQIIEMATTYAKTGKQAQAADWVRQLPLDHQPTTQIKALAAIALIAHRAGNSSFANQLLAQTLQSVDPLDRAYRDRIHREGGNLFSLDRFKPTALASIALVYSQTQQPEKMRQILQQVVALSEKIDDPTIASPLDYPFAQFTEAQQFIGALQIAEGTAFPEVQQSRLQTSAIGLLKLNRWDLVLPIVDRINAPNGKTQLLLAIAQRYAELKQSQKALPILAQAFQVAQTIPGDESIFDHLGIDGGTIIPIETDRGSLTEAIAVQYARLNHMTEAVKVANTLQEKSTREEALQMVRCAGRG